MDERDTRVEGAVEDPDAPTTVEVMEGELAPAQDDAVSRDENETVVAPDTAVEDPDAPVVVEGGSTVEPGQEPVEEPGGEPRPVEEPGDEPEPVEEPGREPQPIEEPDREPEPVAEQAGGAQAVSEPSDQPQLIAEPLEEPAPEPTPIGEAAPEPGPVEEADALFADQFLIGADQPEADTDSEENRKLAILEAIVYVTDEPLSREQIAKALGEPLPYVTRLLDKLVEEYNKPTHGLTVKEVAGGFKMATKPEHHEAVRTYVKNLNPPLKLSLAALETLAVIAYKQPITAPEIMEIRGVQGAGVLKTLIDRKLITTAGRKNVVGKPILYKTTKEFLVQFGLRDLAELPTLKEFEDLRRMAFSEAESPSDVVDGTPVAESASEATND